MGVNKTEIYVSTDVEADGPIPGINSMLSFGSAAYLADKTLVGTFTVNLQTLPGQASFKIFSNASKGLSVSFATFSNRDFHLGSSFRRSKIFCL